MDSEPDSSRAWYGAKDPNYDTNIDLRFPYSGMKFLIPNDRGYELVKIPFSLNNLIEHVDYWGEGRVEGKNGISGFKNSYNINHQFKLVSIGSDENKKIPNRIPVYSYNDPDNSDTSNYIKDNSVLTVTVVAALLTSNSIKDITRIINTMNGKVVVYGVDASDPSPKFRELSDELKKKGFFIPEDYTLPSELEEVKKTYKIYVAFLSIKSKNLSGTSRDVWKNADGPNYSTNINLLYPYSGVHIYSLSTYYPITVHPEDQIHHVDYWGEGRVVSAEGISGFPNSYNVNLEYNLVSSGPDRDKKIPNRIPVSDSTTTTPFIAPNSVLTVTVEVANINRTSWCVKDIARIVNGKGKVVVYGVQKRNKAIKDLTKELKKKGMFLSEDYTLPSELQGLTRFDSHVAYLNRKDLGELSYSHVVNGNYDSAVKMSTDVGAGISKIVNKLIGSAPRNVMIYAFKLWHDHDGAYKDVVRYYFQEPFQYIMSGEPVTIVNKQHNMALKIHFNPEQVQGARPKREILVDGTGLPKNDIRLSWRFLPTCYKDNLTFTLCTVDRKFFLRMYRNLDANYDRECLGGMMFPTGDDTGQGAGNYLFHLEPLIGADGDLVFTIMNIRFKQALKLFISPTIPDGDRRVCGHDGDIQNVEHNRFRWVVKPWPEEEDDILPPEGNDSFEEVEIGV